MATESTAIAHLIDLAQREHQQKPPSGEPPRPEPRRRSRRGVETLVVGLASVLVGASAVFVLYLIARSDGGAAPAAAKVAPAQQRAGAAPLGADVVAATGFDLVVQPAGARVILDGSAIGQAPLRVRNLLPGAHAVSIEAPAGYFGRHMQVTVQAGVAQRLEVVLDPVSAQAAASAPAAAVATAAAPAADATNAAPAATEPEPPRVERAAAARADERRRERRERRAARAERRPERPEPAEAPAPAVAETAGETGTLMVGSKPPCDIRIDGKATGLTTPQRDIELSPGLHVVRLHNTELGIDETFRVRIEAGKTTRAIQDYTAKAASN